MRSYTFIVLLLSAPTFGRLFKEDAYLSEYADDSIIASIGGASCTEPQETVTVTVHKRIELRQGPEMAPVDVSPAQQTDFPDTTLRTSIHSVQKHQVVDPNNPAAAPLALPATATSDWVTTQWVETLIGGVPTWLPHTITIQFAPHLTQGPMPGKGEVGMGTLSAKPGKTETVVVIGGAPTQQAGMFVGAGVAFGIGVVGMMLV